MTPVGCRNLNEEIEKKKGNVDSYEIEVIKHLCLLGQNIER